MPVWVRGTSLAFLAFCLVAGCTGARTAHNGNDVATVKAFVGYTPGATPMAPWPSYLAEDYREYHNFRLSSSQVALVRKTLALVKPCQRAILRYAFPSNPDGVRFVLFFATSAGAWPHVLWTNRVYFKVDSGEVFPMSGSFTFPENSIRYDVVHTSC
jgi:hypothetical protein